MSKDRRWPQLKRRQLVGIIEGLLDGRACYALHDGCVKPRVALVQIDDGRQLWCCPDHLAHDLLGGGLYTEGRPYRHVVAPSDWQEREAFVRATRRQRDERNGAVIERVYADPRTYAQGAIDLQVNGMDCRLAVELVWGAAGLSELDAQDSAARPMYTPTAGS